jgi:hypothetical protein
MAILVEVIHAVKPLTNTTFAKWVDWYGTDVIPAMERSGFEVLGAFKRSTGPMGEDQLLLRFETLGDYERAGLSLRADAAFLKSLGSIAGQFTVVETVKTANFVPYATEQRLERALAERPERPRPYMQAVLQLNQGGQMRAYEAIGQLARILDNSPGMRLVTAYETAVGRRGELTDIWVCPGGVPDFSYRPEDPLAELIAGLREVAPEESIALLHPLPYSKLQ